MTDSMDMVLVCGKYRRRRRYVERRDAARPGYEAAWRLAWALGLPMVIAAQVAFFAAVCMVDTDIGAAAVMMVLYIGLRDMAPKAPNWRAHLAAEPEYE